MGRFPVPMGKRRRPRAERIATYQLTHQVIPEAHAGGYRCATCLRPVEATTHRDDAGGPLLFGWRHEGAQPWT